MEPLKIKNSNRVLGQPEAWNEERDGKCETLAVRAIDLTEGLPVIESAWRPTEDEMALLNAGGSVILRIFGNGMPPVQLYVEQSE